MNNKQEYNQASAGARRLSIPAVVAFWLSLLAVSMILVDSMYRPIMLLTLPPFTLGTAGLICTAWKRQSVRGMSYAIMALVIIMGIMVYADYTEKAQRERLARGFCLNNMKQLVMAMQTYQADHDGYYPPADEWNDSLFPFLRNPRVFVCPRAERIPYEHEEFEYLPTYAMNSNLVGLSPEDIAQPDKTVLLFESIPGANLVGGPELLPSPPRHKLGYVIGFADGHAGIVSESEVLDLIWDPTATE